MLKMFKILFLIAIVFQNAYSACTVSCSAQIQMEKETTSTNLTQNFQTTQNNLKDLKKAYDNQKKALEETNSTLDIKIKLLKEKLLKEQQVLFSLRKFNEIQSNVNSQSAIK